MTYETEPQTFWLHLPCSATDFPAAIEAAARHLPGTGEISVDGPSRAAPSGVHSLCLVRRPVAASKLPFLSPRLTKP